VVAALPDFDGLKHCLGLFELAVAKKRSFYDCHYHFGVVDLVAQVFAVAQYRLARHSFD
jgi:hypothetical protein